MNYFVYLFTGVYVHLQSNRISSNLVCTKSLFCIFQYIVQSDAYKNFGMLFSMKICVYLCVFVCLCTCASVISQKMSSWRNSLLGWCKLWMTGFTACGNMSKIPLFRWLKQPHLLQSFLLWKLVLVVLLIQMVCTVTLLRLSFFKLEWIVL